MRAAILAFALFLSSFLACTRVAAQEQIVLEATSDQGTFMGEITWTPDDVGSKNTFDVRFVEPETGEEIEDVTYDFSIYVGDHREILRRDQTATRQEFTFDTAGSYRIRIDNIDRLNENAQIPIYVTPEFPLGAIATIAAALGAVAILARRNSNNLFSQSAN